MIPDDIADTYNTDYPVIHDHRKMPDMALRHDFRDLAYLVVRRAGDQFAYHGFRYRHFPIPLVTCEISRDIAFGKYTGEGTVFGQDNEGADGLVNHKFCRFPHVGIRENRQEDVRFAIQQVANQHGVLS